MQQHSLHVLGAQRESEKKILFFFGETKHSLTDSLLVHQQSMNSYGCFLSQHDTISVLYIICGGLYIALFLWLVEHTLN